MKFLSNTFDPNHKYAQIYVIREGDQTREQAWDRYMHWLSGKIIGMPQETDKYTVDELIRLNMVGVYSDQEIEMKTKAVSATIKYNVLDLIPNGIYSGIWSGCLVAIEVDGKEIELTVNDGVRGINVPCNVYVTDAGVSVKTN